MDIVEITELERKLLEAFRAVNDQAQTFLVENAQYFATLDKYKREFEDA